MSTLCNFGKCVITRQYTLVYYICSSVVVVYRVDHIHAPFDMLCTCSRLQVMLVLHSFMKSVTKHHACVMLFERQLLVKAYPIRLRRI